jgi:hypothetical protein
VERSPVPPAVRPLFEATRAWLNSIVEPRSCTTGFDRLQIIQEHPKVDMWDLIMLPPLRLRDTANIRALVPAEGVEPPT